MPRKVRRQSHTPAAFLARARRDERRSASLLADARDFAKSRNAARAYGDFDEAERFAGMCRLSVTLARTYASMARHARESAAHERRMTRLRSRSLSLSI